jgi:hypothetical protein
MATPRIRSWRAGKNFVAWHLFNGVSNVPLCGTAVPEYAAWCDLSEHSAGLALDQICRRCLKTFAESETP